MATRAASTRIDPLAGVAFERARVLAPLLAGAMLCWSVLIELTNRPSTDVNVVNGVSCALAAVIALAARRMTTPRWGHAMCSILWCTPMMATLFAQWRTPEPLYVVLVALEIVATAVLLDTRWVIGLLVAVGCLWIPLSLRAPTHDTILMLASVATAQMFAIVMQIIMRRALQLHATTADALKVQLAERLRIEDQLLHSQRMDAVGTLAAGLAHDMNNVLASITSFAGLLDGEVRSAVGRADLDQIIAQSLRGAELTRGLLAFSRHGKYRNERTRIDDVVLEVIPLLARTLPRLVEINHHVGAGAGCVEGDHVQLHQVLVNLCLNAAQAMNGHGTLEISSDVVVLDDDAASAIGLAGGRYARYRVADTGVGMDDATRRRVFEPFFTTKPAGQGTGLGLSTVWGIIQSHRGTVTVESRLGKGTTFICYLPALEVEATRGLRPSTPPPVGASQLMALARTGTVLIADDEPAVLAGTARIVERMNLHALRASNGEQALALYRQSAAVIDLVILDMGMPVMGGAECFRRLRRETQVPVLIATGYAADADVQEMVAGGAGLIEKPYRAADLAEAVTRLIRAARIAQRAG